MRHPLASIGNTLFVDDGLIQRVHEKTLGHPYFVSLVMHDLVAAAYREDTGLTLRLFQARWENVIRHLETEKFEEE